MDWLTFIASLIKSLAWPSVVVALTVGFRHRIASLLSSLSGFRYKDFELQFGQKIELLKVEADQANLPPLRTERERRAGEETPEPPNELLYLTELLEIAPKAAVLEAWREVERAIADAARRMNLPAARTNRDVVRQLEVSGRIDAALMRIIHDLRQLRNSVAHIGEIELSANQAEEYVKLGIRVIGAMREIG